MRRLIRKFIVKNELKKIHIHDIQVARSVFQLKKKLGLTITLDLHENRPEIMRHYKHVKSLLGRLTIFPEIWRKYEEKYAQEADKVIVVTNFAKKELAKRAFINDEKIIALPNTPGLLFTSNASIDNSIKERFQDDFVLLYIGDTSQRRGLLTAIEGLGIIREKITNLKLLIVGKSSFDEQLQKRVKELRLDKQVVFEGWQTPEKLPSYIAASHVGISPLHKNKHHDTTYANKIFQYMAMGLPLLVSDCLAQEAVVNDTHCGLVYDNESAGDFAMKVLDLYSNLDRRMEFSQNAINAVKSKYNWKQTGKVLADYYLGKMNVLQKHAV